MAFSLEVANAFIVIPNSEPAVLSTRNEVLSFGSDVKSVQLVLRSFDGANDLPIIFFPICDFPIRSRCKNLVLFSVEYGLLEGGGLEETQQPGPALEVPNDAGTVTAGTDCLRVIATDLDRPHPAPVLLHRCLHHLRLLSDLPNPDLALSAARYYALSVGSGSDRSAAVVVGVVDDIQ